MAVLSVRHTSTRAPDPALAIAVSDMLARCRNCAQTSFAVLQQEFHLDGGEILKALTPFPGVALRGQTCGAVTGCLAAIGAVHGRDQLDDWNGYVRSLEPAQEFCARFEQDVGSTQCAEILERKLGRRFDLANRTDAADYLAAGGRRACSLVVSRAVAIAAEILREHEPTVAQPAPPELRNAERTIAKSVWQRSASHGEASVLAKAYAGASRAAHAVGRMFLPHARIP